MRADINASLEQLPGELRGSILREFAAPVPTVQDATPAVVEAFRNTDAGALALATWGHDGPRKVATVVARWNRVRGGLDDDGRRWLDWFIDESLQPAEVAAALDVLAA